MQKLNSMLTIRYTLSKRKKPDENASSKKYIAFFKHLGLCAVLVFLWLENQTILLIMQYNFFFAFGDVFYLTD